MSTIAEQVLAVHRALVAGGLPHAFGGALALAFCTADPRGTSDIDLNVFVEPAGAAEVVVALPAGVEWTDAQVRLLERDGRVRLRWGDTPLDLFLTTHPFHREAATRVRYESWLGSSIPVLACQDLAVFKAFVNRTQDWADLEKMAAEGAIAPDPLAAVVAALLGEDDERLARIEALPRSPSREW